MGIIEHRKSVINVICPNCKEEIVDSKLAFCVMCGFKLKGGAKTPGFFTKSPETGVSKADEYAAKTRKAAQKTEAEMPVKPAPPEPAPVPQQAAPAPQEPIPPQAAPQQGMPQMQGMMPQQGMPQMQGMMPQQGMPQMQGMMPQQGIPQMQGMMPQQGMPQMQGMMPQQGMPQMQGMMPQQGMPQMQGMVPPQEGMDPQQNPMQPQMMGMQPQMMGMQPMMGMPQFMGYDPNGTPIYVQMMPQMVGYDAYGNPMYTMVPMQSYGMPQMQGMMPQQGMPQMQGMMPQQGMPQMQGMMPQQGMPQMQGVMPQQAPVQTAPPPAAPVQEIPQTPVQENVVRTSDYYSEMPVSAEALMNEDENAEPPAPPADMPNEAELLNQIFSDKPKQHTMSTGTVASAQTFSISLSANEITSVGEEKPAAAPQAKPADAPAEKPEKPKKAPKPAKGDKKAAAKPEKKPIKVISPDEFFDDNRNKPQRMVGVRVVEELDDEQMEDKLAAMEGKKKSRRSMMAADKNVDPEAALDDPAVEAAAQAILDEESAIDAMNAMQQRLAELQKNPNRKKEAEPNLPLEASWPDQQPPMTMNS